MSQIEVPDWVVEVGAKALYETSPGCNWANLKEIYRDVHRAEAKAAIIAALGAWVVSVGYQETITVQDDGVFADIERKLWHWIPGKPIPESTADTFRELIYTLRQEKPE